MSENSRYSLSRLRQWFVESILKPTSKMEASDVAKSVSLGAWAGMFPCPGITTFVAFLLVFVIPNKFSPAMQALAVATKFLVSPLHYMMIPIFMVTGGLLIPGLECDPLHIIMRFTDGKESFLLAFQESAACLGAGVLMWILTSAPAIFLLYALILFTVHIYRKFCSE